MSNQKKYEFTAEILKTPGVNSGYIEFPYNVQKEFGTKGRVAVKAYFDGYEYRGSLVTMGSPCHWIGLNKEVRTAIKKEPGDMVHVVIFKDTEERKVELPDYLIDVFKNEPQAHQKFIKMSYSHQKEIVQYLTDAKKDETRAKRIVKILEMLEKR